jgi:hypothetical protein
MCNFATLKNLGKVYKHHFKNLGKVIYETENIR